MTQDTPEILEISPKETKKILEQDPEKAKIELEIKKFNRDSKLLNIQDEPSNLGEKILECPWVKLLLAFLSPTTALLVALLTMSIRQILLELMQLKWWVTEVNWKVKTMMGEQTFENFS